MKIVTDRFGAVDVDENRLITFARGLLGFPAFKRYTLIDHASHAFLWLQSIERPDLAFVVTEPRWFEPEYDPRLSAEVRAEISLEDAGEILVIVNRVGQTLTANLQGPLVINGWTMAAMQVVLQEKRYQTRHVIGQLPAAVAR
jgi:flagellar assembly factor FliW